MSAPRIPREAIAFGGNPLERVEEKVRTPEWIAERLADPRTRVLPLRGLRPGVVRGADGKTELEWVAPASLSGAGAPVLLGMRDGVACFAVDASAPDERPPADFRDQLAVVGRMRQTDTGIFAQARTLVDWHARHGFCAKCGVATESQAGGALRKCTNAACGATHYPRTDPVAIMLATHEGRCLLGRSKRFPPGFFSALAGFLEAGETLEDAVRREAFEEAGVRVDDVTYVGSQPWPFPSSLMMGCLCRAFDPAIQVDGEELAEARWFTREQVRAALDGGDAGFMVPPPFAIAHQLLRLWLGE